MVLDFDKMIGEIEQGPQPPRNVRVIDRDGNEHPVEMTYKGLDPFGHHCWMVATLLDADKIVGITADEVPDARCSIVLAMTGCSCGQPHDEDPES